MSLNYFTIINRYLEPNSLAYRIYVPHVTLVTNKALEIGRRLSLDKGELQFIEEAGMLHDIGVSGVLSPKMELEGDKPYICHGYLGREILEAEGLPRHALVADRHTGVGITLEEVRQRNLPVPERSYEPVSQAEKIISYADLFFSKRPERIWLEETPAEIEAELSQFGQRQVEIFREWQAEFGEAKKLI